jgi:glycosyltransferase involved in cell wall biosynthesis
MRILLWHVHGGWMDAFIRGPHTYFLVLDEDGGGGRGTNEWPDNVIDVAPGAVRDLDIDIVVLQRLEEIDAVQVLTGRAAGSGIPTIFVEHNAPQVDVPNTVHPLAKRSDILVAHVSYFNELFWDTGIAPTTVIEHGIVDRGYSYTGELASSGVVINEPVRRWRVTGSDLLGQLSARAPVHVFGMKVDGLADRLGVAHDRVVPAGNLSMDELHVELPKRRLYLHPIRWTSLGLSLLEAMHAGMPVVAIDTTEVRRAVPDAAGFVSTRVSELTDAIARLIAEPELARELGLHAREFALAHYGLGRFLESWTTVLEDRAR